MPFELDKMWLLSLVESLTIFVLITVGASNWNKVVCYSHNLQYLSCKLTETPGLLQLLFNLRTILFFFLVRQHCASGHSCRAQLATLTWDYCNETDIHSILEECNWICRRNRTSTQPPSYIPVLPPLPPLRHVELPLLEDAKSYSYSYLFE